MSKAVRQWRIVTDPENFDRLRDDEGFCHLIALARLLNALRFTLEVQSDSRNGGSSPLGMLLGINVFMYQCGLLVEGFSLTQTMHKHFGSSEIFQDGLAALARERDVQRLVGRLRPVRNEVVFHFDVDLVRRELARLPSDVPFTTSTAGEGDLHYSLADVCAMTAFLGEEISSVEEMGPLVEGARNIAFRFVHVADRLIVHELTRFGWRFEGEVTAAERALLEEAQRQMR